MEMYVPVAQEAVETEDEIFLVRGDVATFDGWAEVVHPAEAAALAAAEKASTLGECSPTTFSFFLDVI